MEFFKYKSVDCASYKGISCLILLKTLNGNGRQYVQHMIVFLSIIKTQLLWGFMLPIAFHQYTMYQYT